VVRNYPAEAFAKGGNSDEHQVLALCHLEFNDKAGMTPKLLLKIIKSS
jgi:hypothetical protein